MNATRNVASVDVDIHDRFLELKSFFCLQRFFLLWLDLYFYFLIVWQVKWKCSTFTINIILSFSSSH